MYQYILFDLDGTLTDPREGITKSVQYALDKMGTTSPELKPLDALSVRHCTTNSAAATASMTPRQSRQSSSTVSDSA